MRQAIVGIGGSGSGAGKTWVACRLIRALRAGGISAGAVKCEPDPLYTSLMDEPGVVEEPGKDTALMREAGAENVLLLRAPREGMQEPLTMALERLSHLCAVIVEGNSAVEALAGRDQGGNDGRNETIEVLNPLIVLFITGVHGDAPIDKESARRVLAISDVLIHGGNVPPEAPEGLEKYSREDPEAFIARVLTLIKGVMECPQK